MSSAMRVYDASQVRITFAGVTLTPDDYAYDYTVIDTYAPLDHAAIDRQCRARWHAVPEGDRWVIKHDTAGRFGDFMQCGRFVPRTWATKQEAETAFDQYWRGVSQL